MARDKVRIIGQGVEPLDHAPTGTGVQRRDHEVTGHRRPKGHRSRFLIANLADHQHLGVLPQQMFQRLGERQPALGIDLGLHDAGHYSFHRILHRDDMAGIRLEQPLQQCVNGGGLAAASRAGQQNHPEPDGQLLLQRRVYLRRKTELAECQLIRLVKQSQHQLLAGDRRVGGDAHITRKADLASGNSAILRERVNVSLELGQILDPAKNPRCRLARQFANRN